MRGLIVPLLIVVFGLLLPQRASAHDDANDARVVPRYPSYPYAEHTEGYVRRLPLRDTGGEQAKLWSARVAAEGGYLGKRGYRAGGRILLRYWRLGLSAEAHYYSGSSSRAPFHVGTAHWTIDLIMRPHFGLRAGPGIIARMPAELSVGSRPPYEYGTNVMTEVDVIPIHPVVASARFDVGRLGEYTAVSGRGSLGVMLRRVEVSVGYEAKVIGDMAMRGPQVGLRAWF
ncbi:MAG: hypothetical protein ACE37F_22735 [Nannocystaceae bacterium]|nr:hypothetical protein [bacterium]